jgi:peptidoglycan-associated lipoprotein
MKRTLLMVLALVLIVPGLLMTTACSKKKTTSTEGLTSTQQSGPKGPTTSTDRITRDTRSDTGVTGTGYVNQDRFVNEDVYYAYDSSALDASAQGVLKSKADFMRTNSNAAVTIEGHCDERGTSEYNMALGQKRADSAKKFMINLGVPASKMNTVSFGKERAIDPGHSEAAWSKNRRAHFALQQ